MMGRPMLSMSIACTALALAATPLWAKVPRWIVSWGSAQMPVDGDDALPAARLTDATLRQIVHLSAGGPRLRIRLSNAFGTAPLAIAAAGVARAGPAGNARTMGTGQALRFSGRPAIVIPAGVEIWSDPVALPLPAGSDLAIDLYMPQPPAPQTGHPGARATIFTVAGNRIGAPDLPQAQTATHWHQIADVEVEGVPGATTIVAIGDSITDGYGVAPDSNRRWPDRLAERLRADPATAAMGVVNAGIGGNRVLLDGLGPSLLARFDRDVIARSGVRHAILLEGVNDLGVLTRDAPVDAAAHAGIVAAITGGYTQVVARAHAHGIRVTGGTITPFAGNDYYHPGPQTEADRQAINAFIRTSGTFDAVVDFDRTLRDPKHPDRLNPAFDSGDHLHPSPAGYRVMGDAVPLALFGAAPPPAPARPQIAITFDDLPAHGPLPPGVTRLAIADRTIAALKAHGITTAHGFLNGGFGLDDPQSPQVIAAWRAAGYPLGNHSYSHGNLDDGPPATFEADVIRNEPGLRRAMGGADWRWFRYPFLSEGRDPATRNAVRAFLGQRGYRVAAVTMGFGDYAWNPPYARCVARGDMTAITALESGYLAAARDAAVRARALSQATEGRDIPYVLLMHLGAFDAHMMPRLLDLYDAMGFRFVSLPEAERDPFYAAARNLAVPGTATLEAVAAARSIAVPSPAAALPGDGICA